MRSVSCSCGLDHSSCSSPYSYVWMFLCSVSAGLRCELRLLHSKTRILCFHSCSLEYLLWWWGFCRITPLACWHGSWFFFLPRQAFMYLQYLYSLWLTGEYLNSVSLPANLDGQLSLDYAKNGLSQLMPLVNSTVWVFLKVESHSEPHLNSGFTVLNPGLLKPDLNSRSSMFHLPFTDWFCFLTLLICMTMLRSDCI